MKAVGFDAYNITSIHDSSWTVHTGDSDTN